MIKENPNKLYAQTVLDLLLKNWPGSHTVGELTFRYVPQGGQQEQHSMGLARTNGRATTEKQERELLDSLLLALREFSRRGGSVVTVYPSRDRTRTTSAGALYTIWRWQSAPTGQLFQLGEAEYSQAMRWITAVSEREKDDRKIWQPGPAEERQGALL